MAGRLGVLREVARDPKSRRAVLAFALFATAEQAAWIAILVYAYKQGGAAGAGIAAVAQLLPSAFLAPLLSLIGDRRRDLALPFSYGIEALALGLTASGLLLGAPFWAVIVAGTLATSALATTRPAHAAVLPMISRTPEVLTAANVASGLALNLGNFSGPALAGIVLRFSGPGLTYAIIAVTSLLGLALTLGVVGRSEAPAEPVEEEPVGSVIAELREGVAILGRDPNVRVVALTEAGRELIVGALELLMVAVAVDLIGTGEGGAGLLNAFLGLGGLVGAAVSVTLIGRRRLVPAIATGNFALGIPLAAAAGVPTALTVPAFVFFSGAGQALTQVAAQTLLQRSLPERVRARGFGALEGLTLLALAAGAVAASTLLATVGVRGALAVAGAFAPFTLLVSLARLTESDRAAHAPDPMRIALLRRIPMFAPLPLLELEGVASALRPMEIADGETLMEQGDVGDRFYVLATGRLSILKDGVQVATCEPGGYVGEIALLRDVPRTATVVATEPSLLLALERAPFLEAVTGHPQSREAAEQVADARSRDAALEDPPPT
ncbi:MAG: cyclic nucleotide-binding domain-containing protein [Actinomycetota bacterium]